MRRLDWEGSQTVPPEVAAWAKDPGFNPLCLLGLMRRFAKIDPLKVHEIQSRNLDPHALKQAWIEMSDEADAKITHLADTLPDNPDRRRLRRCRRQTRLARRESRAHDSSPEHPRLPPARGWSGAGNPARVAAFGREQRRCTYQSAVLFRACARNQCGDPAVCLLKYVPT